MRGRVATFVAPPPAPVFREVPHDPVGYAYGGLIEHSGDLMDLAMKNATAEQAALIVHLAQAMSERMLVVRELAEQRLARIGGPIAS